MGSTEMNHLYKSIAEGKVILFLGAGASLTENKGYLSKHLIQYYRDLRNISYLPQNNDIVDFVDKVFSLPEYDRNDFDFQISCWLRDNLKPEDYHKDALSLPWLSIFTTNVDTLIENIIHSNNLEDSYEIIRNIKELNYSMSTGDKCKVIKLHGCISDISKYKLLFSSADFDRNEKYYNRIFSIIQEQSNDVDILFIGYSFNDKFGNLFLNKFDDKMKGRKYYVVDPYIADDEFNLKYYCSKNITPIKTDYQGFIGDYQKWYLDNKQKLTKKKTNIFFDSKGHQINPHLQNKIKPFLTPLNDTYVSHFIEPKNYYLGEEPNFGIIKANYDVIKQAKVNEVSEEILKLFESKDISYPFVFLSGSYGTGKSTFTYRLLKHLIDSDDELLVYEITDSTKIVYQHITDLINSLTETKRIIFYCDNSELDLDFKKLRELRGYLSSMQFPDKSIMLLQSIRENSLEKFRKKLNPTLNEINIDCEFSEEELTTLVEKFYHNQLIEYKGEKQKRDLIENIKVELKIYDQLILSLFLLKNGKHSKFIIDTFKNFEYKSTQKAFTYTCLLYQFGIKMPFSLLSNILNKDWNTFIDEVVKVDGKGIFIQEKLQPDKYLKSDLYFKIKHNLIAKVFIEKQVKKKDLYKSYQNLVQNLPESEESVYIFINLIKALISSRTLDDSKINHLFDIAYHRLNIFTRFNIYYTRNLQRRGLKSECTRALEILQETEYNEYEYSNSRNKFIIHRKACVNAELAKLHFKEEEYNLSKEYVDEAIELFEIKEAIDPSSYFSYKQFLEFLIWYYNKWSLSEYEKTRIELKINKLINKGIDNVQDGINQLISLRNSFQSRVDKIELSQRVDGLIEETETRPIGLILKYELIKNNSDYQDLEELVEEMENYSYNDDVAQFLFEYYGNRLQFYDYRMKFFNLLRNSDSLVDREYLNYLYYSFIAESYNYRFKDAFEHQKEIVSSYKYSMVKKPQYWKDNESYEDRIFQGKVDKNKWGYFDFKIADYGLRAKLNNRAKDLSKEINKTYSAKLYFTYTGIWGELIEEIP